MNQNLYEVWIRAKPAVHHPNFWGLQFGYVILWVMGADSSAAGESARAMFAHMPFEMAGSLIRIKKSAPLPKGIFQDETTGQWMEQSRQQALLLGFAVMILACPPGGDETGFATEFERDAVKIW